MVSFIHPVAMEVVHTDTYIKIQYEAGPEILVCDWIGFQSKEGIEHGSDLILQQVIQKHIRKILNNHSRVTGPWTDSTDWVKQVWFPAIIDAGVIHLAWVHSSNPFAALAASKAIPPDSIVKEFEQLSEALDWLHQLG